jgi:glutathione S-transferase
MPTIYQYPRSPFCIAVIQALVAGGISPELIEVPSGDRSSIIKLTNGAYYQVPVLDDDGKLVYESGPDSQDIAEYIDERYLQHRLFPVASRGWQAIVNHYLENEVEAVTFKVGDAVLIPQIEDVVERTPQIRHKERKFGPGCLARWQQERPAMIAEATRLLRPFEQVLATNPRGFLWGAACLQRLSAVRHSRQLYLPRHRQFARRPAGAWRLAQAIASFPFLKAR